jgi:plasmid stability protein
MSGFRRQGFSRQPNRNFCRSLVLQISKYGHVNEPETPDQTEIAVVRFYFHLRAGDEMLTDDEGQDLPDLSAARCEAEQAARELLAEAIRAGKQEVPEAFVIADEDGREIDIVPLAAALPKRLRPPPS